jgi:hypothetical protein
LLATLAMTNPRRARTPSERRLFASLVLRAKHGGATSPTAYMLREGMFYRHRLLTADQAQYVSAVRRRTRPRHRECWNNSRRVVLLHDFENRFAYCDGMAFVNDITAAGHSLFHGWLVLDSVVPVDFTLSNTVAFYGVAFSRAAVNSALAGRPSPDVASLVDDWRAGWPLVRAERTVPHDRATLRRSEP